MFTAVRALRDELGGLDRVIVNAGLGKGAPVGTGRFDADLHVADTPIRVTTLEPGFIRTDLDEGMTIPFAVDTVTGSKAMADAVERAPASAYVPAWPLALLGRMLRVLPTPVLRRVT